ncbi:MAG TPA: S8 family serine peptidase [Ignavibacteria bacterium]|nr:S8 family serine peptidase [Ignavibacteria bacterium]
MKKNKLILNLISLLIFVTSVLSFKNNPDYSSKISTNLRSQISYNSDNLILQNEKILVWIYFIDKNDKNDKNLNSGDINSGMNKYLTEKSIDRRNKRVKSDSKFDYKDLPVNSDYIRQISDLGIKIKQKSKWFNSVSCYASVNEISQIAEKDFVKKIDIVNKYKSSRESFDNLIGNEFQNNITPSKQSTISYGLSYTQDTLINVPPVHSLGHTGEGILIASFDAGFNNLSHNCFSRMIQYGLRTYDFVNGDTIVADGNGRLGNGSHGTLTLSLIGGFEDGYLISPAFDSKYILAKTENTDSETPLEEDNWIAAAEWADSLGADIISCSLGYLEFDPPYESYTWESMNGNTALITIAADVAVSKGIIVVISSGNSGNNSLHNTLSAPADGFNVITVGSVNLNRQRSVFSSVGPTSDGRIKPELMALGSFNYCAKPGSGNSGYTNSATGTSLACPMVAGVCALLLSANPYLSPSEVKEILKSTADNNSSPNSKNGWGIVNAHLALEKALDVKFNTPESYQLSQNYPNPFNPETIIKYELNVNKFVSIKVYDILGKEISTLVNENKNPGSYNVKFNSNGISSGIYFYSLYVNGNKTDSKKMVIVK